MKSKCIWMSVGSVITIFLIACYTFFTSYYNNVAKTAGIYVAYKHESFITHLSSDVRDYITDGKKSLYFGELPPQEKAIEINAPGRATIFVYPSDANSVIVRYEPRKGIKRNYKISGYGNFDKILKAFYELTGNEIFSVS